MKDRDRFLKLCVLGFKERGVTHDERYKLRFKKELKEIDAQGEHEYFLSLYEKFRSENIKFPVNQHNNITDYLLGLTDEFDIDKPSTYIQGEFPDIDIDYLKPVRDYIKRTWAPITFGQDFICEIGTYGTSGIKSAMLDMAKILSADKETLQQITNKMADKDDEGHELEWDKALEMYKEFREYCEANPRVADAARMLLDRIRSGGVHAGGLIIADRRLDGFVPLEVRMVNKDNPNGVICSAWTEGLNRQDLGPVGLIKFDLLVISNLMQIALCCKLVKERHGIDSISALPGLWDFSDLSYLNDPKAIQMANQADLKCIFQFDSEGIRKVVKRGGVSSFDDLAAYSALYRPGPLNMGMDVHYCRRKKGEEPYNIHPLMEKSLGMTYGVLVYQEQIMDILRVVGEIPDMHTEKVRKAISKKKVKDFIKYKEMFIENGQKNLNVNAEYVLNLWDQIESFAEYGFNKSVLKHTKIPYVGGEKEIQDFVAGDIVYCVNQEGKTVETEVVALHDHGEIEGFEVTFDDGYQVICSANHKFLTENGQVSISEICRTRSYVLSAAKQGVYQERQCDVAEVEHGVFSFFDRSDEDGDLGLGAGHAPISDTGNLVRRKVVRVVPVGRCHMFDLEVANPTHNFLLPNGIVTSNSHSYAYTYISARLLYLKAHYPLEFYTAILMCENDTDKFKEYKLDAKKHGIDICPVHINKSKQNFSINDNKIYFGFSNIKGIGDDVADRIVANQPYRNISDFLERFGTDATPVKAFTSLGVFEEEHDRLTLRKFAEFYKKQIGNRKDRKKRYEQAMDKKLEELKKLLLEVTTESDPDFEEMCKFTHEAEVLWAKFSTVVRQVPYKYKGEERFKEVSVFKMLQDLARRRQSSITNFDEKERDDEDEEITIDQFNPAIVKIDEAEEKILTDELIVDGQRSFPMAESLYYGFQWMHILETSPDYDSSATIDKFLEEADKGMISGPIHVQIKSVKKRTSAKGTEFWSIGVEDANGKNMTVNVWRDDFMRFQDEFKEGMLVAMVCNPPGGGFNTLTFKGVPRNERKNLGPKEADGRLVVLRLPEKSDPKQEEAILDDLIYDEHSVDILRKPEPTVTENEMTIQYEFLKTSEEPFFGD